MPIAEGVRFGSRHGDDLALWAIFERPGDDPASRHLHQISSRIVDTDDVNLIQAMGLHGLTWRDS
ncbi:hypothetical protein E0W80_16705 [Microbacterium sp. PI-1]|uniref:hypothetical protein n=1 Tax=Microbacterium sp. PI-1 TaxID=2545631 RepID=UPI00103F4732|nr:hypothetical protein [Microbacterium sp. PI-1]TCJ21415.1 hypothetical protein E0W80_16705 [Microbacterium sp. PI-1]